MSWNGVSEHVNPLPSPLAGRFSHTLDPKRRLTIPAGWREQMGLATRTSTGKPDYVFVMPDIHKKCLSLFSLREMAPLIERLRQKSFFDARVAEINRRLGAASENLPLDVQGRIRIRDRLLAFAGLESEVVMIGAFNRIELWNPARNPEPEEIDLEGLAELSQGIEV